MVGYGSGYSGILQWFYNYGIVDVLLPFLLVFTIIFAVMRRTHIMGDNRKFDGMIALILALLFVVPHVMGTYPLGYDPVAIMNSALPSISLLAIAAIMLLLLMGIFGADFAEGAAPIIALVSIIFVIYIFGASFNFWRGPYDIFNWWTSDVTELIIIILVFGVIVWWVTHEPQEPGEKTSLGRWGDVMKNLVKKE